MHLTIGNNLANSTYMGGDLIDNGKNSFKIFFLAHLKDLPILKSGNVLFNIGAKLLVMGKVNGTFGKKKFFQALFLAEMDLAIFSGIVSIRFLWQILGWAPPLGLP